MARYQEIGANVRGASFDTARRLVKAQEDVLGALEQYQDAVADEVRTPWAGVKITYDFAKQLLGIQSELALEWTNAFAHYAKQSVKKANKSASIGNAA